MMIGMKGGPILISGSGGEGGSCRRGGCRAKVTGPHPFNPAEATDKREYWKTSKHTSKKDFEKISRYVDLMSGDPQFQVCGGFWLIELLLVGNVNK